jgi:hypothetical protein
MYVDAVIFVVAAAVADVMLRQPETALATVAPLDELDRPFMDGTEGRLDEATTRRTHPPRLGLSGIQRRRGKRRKSVPKWANTTRPDA